MDTLLTNISKSCLDSKKCNKFKNKAFRPLKKNQISTILIHIQDTYSTKTNMSARCTCHWSKNLNDRLLVQLPHMFKHLKVVLYFALNYHFYQFSHIFLEIRGYKSYSIFIYTFLFSASRCTCMYLWKGITKLDTLKQTLRKFHRRKCDEN